MLSVPFNVHGNVIFGMFDGPKITNFFLSRKFFLGGGICTDNAEQYGKKH